MTTAPPARAILAELVQVRAQLATIAELYGAAEELAFSDVGRSDYGGNAGWGRPPASLARRPTAGPFLRPDQVGGQGASGDLRDASTERGRRSRSPARKADEAAYSETAFIGLLPCSAATYRYHVFSQPSLLKGP
jgi:hypothetical protein